MVTAVWCSFMDADTRPRLFTNTGLERDTKAINKYNTSHAYCLFLWELDVGVVVLALGSKNSLQIWLSNFGKKFVGSNLSW